MNKSMLAFCLLLAAPFAGTILLRPNPAQAAEVADLRDQLEKGLKARRPVEFQFIARVVTMVENDQLPIDLVKSTFQWAREKGRFQYPFPYFERGLRERAAKLGIQI